MYTDRARTHEQAAIGALAERGYRTAGDRYTRAARAHLADPREDPSIDPTGADPKGWAGQGVAAHALGAVAYRLADRPDRAAYRAAEGVAVARDLRTALDRPGQAACLGELVGHLRVCGGLDGAADSYETAAEAYETAGVEDPLDLATTPLFEAATGVVQQVARGPADGEIAVTFEDLHGPDPSDPGAYLAARARYAARRLPGLVERVLEAGYLAAPRGTTEYDNATYRCPACDSRDVNWTGDEVLCLRCSTPVVEAE